MFAFSTVSKKKQYWVAMLLADSPLSALLQSTTLHCCNF